MSLVTRLIPALLLFAASTGLFIWFLKDDAKAPAQDTEGPGPVAAEISTSDRTVGGPAATGLSALSGTPLLQSASAPAEPGQRGMPITLSGIDQLVPGESITLYIPQEGNVYGGRVAEVVDTASGNRIVSGFVDDNGVEYRFLFTVGRLQTFGTIYTPASRYQLETRSGTGMIVSSQTISEGLDFSKPDFVIPDPRQEPDAETLRGD